MPEPTRSVSSHQSRFRSVLLFLAGAAALLVFALVAGWPDPIIAEDVQQERLNAAPPAPVPGAALQQTFRPNWDGLTEVELLLVNFAPDSESRATFTVTLTDAAGRTVYRQTYDARQLMHNESLVVRFAPEVDSAGRLYELTLAGDAQNQISAWAYDVDVYAAGALTGPALETPHDLQLVTRYRLSWPAAFSALATRLRDQATVILLALLLLPLPGLLLLTCWTALGRFRYRLAQFFWGGARAAPPAPPPLDPVAWLGLAVALGVATWPMLWFWMTLLGARWSTATLWLFTILGWLLVGACAAYRRRNRVWPPAPGTATKPVSHLRRWHWQHLLLLGILLLGFAVRLLAVRDLAFPAWVDASRHGLITAVMRDSGQVIESYAPYLPVERFPYHFGFHTIAASLALLGNFSLPTLLLVLGQLLNALVPLSMYTAGWLLTRRRTAALVAAFLVALPFFFPAYYATWGRFTQLAGVVVLPPLIALTWLLMRGGRVWQWAWWIVALLAAGLLLIHIRVFLIYLPFAALVLLLSAGRHARALLAAGVLALVLTAPRLIAFAGYARTTGTLTAPAEGYNAFPTAYVEAGWESYFLWAGAAAVLLAVLAHWRRRAWGVLVLSLASWAALVLILFSGRLSFLPGTWLINLNSIYITLFVPLGLGLAVAAARLGRFAQQYPGWVRYSLWFLFGALFTLLLVFGIRQQIDILNPVTVLARPADLPALEWAEQQLPADALVGVNSWQWLGNTWAGSDGGAWLVPLTGRSSTAPPVDYVFDDPLRLSVLAFNSAATQIEDWSTPQAAAWLRQQGVTHVFIGARGGFLDPAQLLRNPELELLYSHDGVFIFALR